MARGHQVTPRRAQAEVDALRARMVRDGYPLAGLSYRDNERIWISLSSRVRRTQVCALLGLSDAQVDAAVRRIRAQHFQATGKR